MRFLILLFATFTLASPLWAATPNITLCNKTVAQMVADTNASKADLPRRVKSGEITPGQSASTAIYYDKRLAKLNTMTDATRQKQCTALQKAAKRFPQFRQGAR